MECRKHGTIKAVSLYIRTKRADRNAAVTKKWQVQESDHGCRQRRVANANPLPVEGYEYDRQKFHRYSYPKCQSRNATPAAHQCGKGHQQQQRANNINVTASRNFNGQQGVPGERQNQVRSLPGTTQDIEQQENNREFANHKCYFQCKGGLMNRGHCVGKKLRSCWIWAR